MSPRPLRAVPPAPPSPLLVHATIDDVRRIVREELEADRARRAGDETPAEWLDVDAVAKRLGVNERTVRRLAKSGELPAGRVGDRLLRFRCDDVEAYLRRPR